MISSSSGGTRVSVRFDGGIGSSFACLTTMSMNESPSNTS